MDVTRTAGGGITGMSISNSSAEINNSQLNVSGTGHTIGVNALSDLTVNIIESEISVTSTNATLPVIGLLSDRSRIDMLEGVLAASTLGSNGVLASGPNTALVLVTCILNGTTVVC